MFSNSIVRIVLLLCIAAGIQSCSYSIIMYNQRGTAEPDPLNHVLGFYNGKQVTIVDTIVKLSLLQDQVMAVNACPIGAFHSVEYKITFGAMLRNTFSLGKRQSIKVKYVCLKNSND